MADIREVNKNLINNKGLIGALFACPILVSLGTVILRGKIIKNKTHQIKINIKTWVKIAIKI